MPGDPLSQGTLIWSGEHWLNYLRRPGADTDSALLSLYHAHYSAGGEGTVAFVDIPGRFTGACTNSREFARFIIETMIRGSGNPFDCDMPLLDATLERSGDVRTAPCWTIQTPDHRIASTWSGLQEPLVGPPTINKYIVFTVFCFADQGSIVFDGRNVEGRPYPREGWRQNLGEPGSSSMFALAETMIQPS